jgi:hypothetical protein
MAPESLEAVLSLPATDLSIRKVINPTKINVLGTLSGLKLAFVPESDRK